MSGISYFFAGFFLGGFVGMLAIALMNAGRDLELPDEEIHPSVAPWKLRVIKDE